MIDNIIHECTTWKTQLVLQTSLPLQSSTHTRDLLNNITDLQPTLANVQREFLAALESNRHGRRLGRSTRQLLYLDVDMGWATGRNGFRGPEHAEEQATGPCGAREGVVGRSESGYCGDGDGHGCGVFWRFPELNKCRLESVSVNGWFTGSEYIESSFVAYLSSCGLREVF